MNVLWFISIVLYQFRLSYAWFWPWVKYDWPEQEKWHMPGAFTSLPSPYVNNTETKIMSPSDTPDYRIEEPHFKIFTYKFPHENERPYRNSPPYKQSQTISRWSPYWQWTERQMGCFCCTTYRKFTVLAGCAVITTRHILTTATPTVMMLRSYGSERTLYNILGGWYDTDHKGFNSSMYFTPSRIHIHPKYAYDYEVNVSHPIPCMYDLSVWAVTHTFYGSYLYSWGTNVIICNRAASGWHHYSSSIPGPNDMSIVAGFLFMKAYKRRPMPWYRYIIKTFMHVWPCPKSEWHWFHCIMGEYWGRYGFDSGGGMHAAYRGRGGRNDGFIGMCSFSLKLRAKQTTHYFTVIDTHPVLDFLYDAFLGLQPYAYLDGRFENTKWAAPIPFWGEYIQNTYQFGYASYYYHKKFVPRYRR